MTHAIHPKSDWLTPTQVVRLTGRSRYYLRTQAINRTIRTKENPTRKGCMLFHRGDIERKVLLIDPKKP